MLTTALHSPKQAEEWWPQVRETFHDWYRRLLRHTHGAHVRDNMQRRAHNNFKFTFQMTSVGLLNRKDFRI